MYGIVNQEGRYVRGLGDMEPKSVSLNDGERLSYKHTVWGVRIDQPSITFKQGSGEGEAWLTSSHGVYQLWASAEDIDSLVAVVTELKSRLGSIDMTPKRLAFPKLPSALQRLMYLVRYVVSGEIE